MKKHFNQTVFSLVLLLLIAFLASGCTQPSQDASEGTGESTQHITESKNNSETIGNTEESTGNTEQSNAAGWEQYKTVLSGPVTQYVQIDDSKTVTYKPQLSAQEITIPISIPKLLLSGDDATACQAEIARNLESELKSITEGAHTKTSPSYLYIKFEAYLNGDILSIMVESCNVYDRNSYYTYNFDVPTGKRLDTNELMEKIQFSDYTAKATQAAKTSFESKYGKDGNSDLYKDRLNATIDPKNIAEAKPYLDQDGKLKVIVYIGSMAGASGYYEILPLA